MFSIFILGFLYVLLSSSISQYLYARKLTYVVYSNPLSESLAVFTCSQVYESRQEEFYLASIVSICRQNLISSFLMKYILADKRSKDIANSSIYLELFLAMSSSLRPSTIFHMWLFKQPLTFIFSLLFIYFSLKFILAFSFM